MRQIRFRSSIAACVLIGVSTFAAPALKSLTRAADSAAPAQSAVHAQAEARLLGDIKYLASDELEGRGVGTAGLNKAAEYIRHEFQAAGLDVTRVQGDAFQKFKMSLTARLGTPNSLTFIWPDGKRTVLKQDVDFRPCSFGGWGKIQGELAFGGYAIDAKKYHDFKGVDLKGKAVIVMRRGLRQDDTSRGDLRTKLNNAAAAGASALLIVNDPASLKKSPKDNESRIRWATNRVVDAALALEKAAPGSSDESEARKDLSKTVRWLKKVRADAAHPENDDQLMTFGTGGNGKDADIPVVQLSITAADRVLKAATGKSLGELQVAIDQGLKPKSTVLSGWKADGVTTIKRAQVEVKNVIGVLEGAGPHADETVVIGAHYDHVGRGGPGSGSLLESSHEIHNGADDNASGTCALLELARHFGRQPKKLPRRLVFIAFTGEEEGLLGSAHYAKEPVFPIQKTVAMLNLDMVGRLREDKLTVYGLGTSKDFQELVERTTAARHFKLIPKPEGYGPSDQSSFYAKKIPVLFFFTGTHTDYHRPTDDWQKINIAGMDRIVDLVEEIATTIVTAPARPGYIDVNGQGTFDRGGSRPYFGSIPDFSSQVSGYSLSGVAPGSPADRAGLKGGDRIIEMGNRTITGLDDFDLVLRRFSASDEVPVVAIRGGKPIHLKVTLRKRK